jgi:DNA-binding NtrC family response regulator
MEKQGKILIVDDNEDILFALKILLDPYIEQIELTAYPETIPRFIDQFQPDVVLLDMNFRRDANSGEEGFEWLGRILQQDPSAVVVMMTAYADMDKAMRAIRLGAMDFIAKPWEREKLLATIHSALKLRASQRKANILSTHISGSNALNTSEIIGQSPSMLQVLDMIERVASTDANVLILGENGTGKDLVARHIHNRSLRREGVFVSLDLGTISESLFESELFGYEKGAFTNALKRKVGRIEIASGGTLFLDEIANLSPAIQAKMLTALERREITHLGSTQAIEVDVRLVSATNSDIYAAVEQGEFRRDLLYRINTIEVTLPPLRNRGEDILLLADYFLARFSNKYKKDISGLSPSAVRSLVAYSWPGNVRELQNAIERAVIISQGKELDASDFAFKPTKKGGDKPKESDSLNLESIEQQTIQRALTLSCGNIGEAAKLLGISRYALYRKMGKK